MMNRKIILFLLMGILLVGLVIGANKGSATQSTTTPSITYCLSESCQEIDNVWRIFNSKLSQIDASKKTKIYSYLNKAWVDYSVVYGVSSASVNLQDVNIISKILPGKEDNLVNLKQPPFLESFNIDAGVTYPQVNFNMYNALLTFAKKAKENGFNKKITITSAYRSGSGSLHFTGNAVDIRTNDLSLNERLILIKSAIESGFGEIYHGASTGTFGLSDDENKKLECFWLDTPTHNNHLHLGLESTTQTWETCIKK